MSSKVWIIEPRDPFIARDGKPFSVGTRAASLPFPFPSTTTGGARTRAGLDGSGIFDPHRQVNSKQLTKAVMDVAVRGSLLVELNESDDIERWMMPAPADALIIEDEHGVKEIKQLVPLNVSEELTNINQPPHAQDKLVPVGLTAPDMRKPYEMPRFWCWEKFSTWLLNPDSLIKSFRQPSELGHKGATNETRTHVAIDPQKLTALDGQLFQTKGMEFTFCEPAKFGGKDIKNAKRLALAVCVDDNNLTANIKEGFAPLGGERRIVAWRESKQQLPTQPQGLFENISNIKACRLMLLTPAYFTNGSSPQWLREASHNVDVELRAIAHGRAQVVSGWDFVTDKPKPTRRLAPPGTTLFLKLNGEKADVETWLNETWMRCVSDTDETRRDGFGLAAIGTWNGSLEEMKAGVSDEKNT